jgi:hypothetical protein
MKRSRAYFGWLVLGHSGWSQPRKSETRNPKAERRPKPEARKQEPAWDHGFRFALSAALRGTTFHCLLLSLFCAAAPTCFGQRQNEPRPAPLNPVQAEKEARALVAEMLAQRPEQNVTNTGWITISDAEGKERKTPVRFEVTSTPTNWFSVYETLPRAGGPGGLKLTVVHSGDQPNRYELIEPAAAGATNAVAKVLTRAQIMAPFAGSDFWIADLGLEFLHWPRQRVLLLNDMKHGKACRKLESTNPKPVPGGYARVESWIMIASPHGIVHADAYDARGDVLKHFEPTNVEKIQGEYQLEEIAMRNPDGSRTLIKFNLARE